MPQRNKTRAFTLTELMVVIGVIVILIGILIPVVTRVKIAAQEARTKSFIAELSGAMDNYFSDHHAYPGPLSNDQLYTELSGMQPPAVVWVHNGAQQPFAGQARITEAENALLGLLGGMTLTPPTGSGAPGQIFFDDSLVGKGALSLNSLQPKRYSAYIGTNSLVSGYFTNTQLGQFSDESGSALDTVIPEFVDQFNNPMPILILRANIGRTSTQTTPTPQDNNIITDGQAARRGHYDVSQIIGYTAPNNNGTRDNNRQPALTSRSIGVGKDLPEICTDGSGNMVSWKNKPAFHGLHLPLDTHSNLSLNDRSTNTARAMYYFPYDAYAYFSNPQLPMASSGLPSAIPVPRQQNRYILISAGKDRIYGTDDDITNFGAVGAGQ